MSLRIPKLAAAALAAAFLASAAGGPLPLSGPAVAAAAACPGSDSGPRRISSERAAELVVCLVNKRRSRHGLSQLQTRETLSDAARAHSEHMQRTECFDHACPGEAALSGRYAQSDYLPCGCTWGAAENIAWGPRRKGSPRSIVDAWMGSSPHRSNILNGAYRDVGVGVLWGSPDKRGARAGTYTLDFGYRR